MSGSGATFCDYDGNLVHYGDFLLLTHSGPRRNWLVRAEMYDHGTPGLTRYHQETGAQLKSTGNWNSRLTKEGVILTPREVKAVWDKIGLPVPTPKNAHCIPAGSY